MKKLYVGNLAFETNESSLREFFADYGPIASVNVIKDKFTEESRGFGFIELEDNSNADKAVKELDGEMLDGRRVKVNEARQDDRQGGGGGRRS